MLTLFKKRICTSSRYFEPGDLRKLTSAYKSEYKLMVNEKSFHKRKPKFDLFHSDEPGIVTSPFHNTTTMDKKKWELDAPKITKLTDE